MLARALQPFANLFARAGGRALVRSSEPVRLGDRRWDGMPVSPGGPVLPPQTRARARHLVNTATVAASAKNALVDASVSYGIHPTSQHPVESVREALATAWGLFTDKAGLHGENVGNVMRTVASEMFVAGDGLAYFIETEDGLRVQPLRAEQLDDAKTGLLSGGGRIDNGVQRDAYDRITGYWIVPADPFQPFGGFTHSVYVPSADLVHVFERPHPGALRGVSRFAAALLDIAELDKLNDANLLGVQAAAMVMGVITDQNGNGSVPFDGDQVGSIMTSGMEPGTIKVLPSGYSFQFNAPDTAPHGIAVAQHMVKIIAAAVGVPAHLISGDVSQANYSSLRADMTAFKARVEALQWSVLIPGLCQPMWNRAIRSAVVRGELDLPGFWSDPTPFYNVEWFPPPLPSVDPVKEAVAIRAMIAMGLMSRRQAAAALGFNIEDLDREIAADRAREAKLGLTFDDGRRKPQEAA